MSQRKQCVSDALLVYCSGEESDLATIIFGYDNYTCQCHDVDDGKVIICMLVNCGQCQMASCQHCMHSCHCGKVVCLHCVANKNYRPCEHCGHLVCVNCVDCKCDVCFQTCCTIPFACKKWRECKRLICGNCEWRYKCTMCGREDGESQFCPQHALEFKTCVTCGQLFCKQCFSRAQCQKAGCGKSNKYLFDYSVHSTTCRSCSPGCEWCVSYEKFWCRFGFCFEAHHFYETCHGQHCHLLKDYLFLLFLGFFFLPLAAFISRM